MKSQHVKPKTTKEPKTKPKRQFVIATGDDVTFFDSEDAAIAEAVYQAGQQDEIYVCEVVGKAAKPEAATYKKLR